MAGRYAIGVDVGGTKIATGLTDFEGRILARSEKPTGVAEGNDAVIETLFSTVEDVLAKSGVSIEDVAGIGLGCPGPLSVKDGIIIDTPNLNWKNYPIRKIVHERFGIPVYLDNDANAAGQGERWFGAGRGTENMIYITVSTGIGGGIIINSRTYLGAKDYAGEIGHINMIEDGPLCGCGRRGCLEAISSGTAIGRRGRERVLAGEKSIMLELAGGDVEKINSAIVAEAARRGDAVAKDIISFAMRYLGIAVGNLVSIFNPEIVVIGGGVSKIGDMLFEPVRLMVNKTAIRASLDGLRIVPAELGGDAGLLGAVTLVLERETAR